MKIRLLLFALFCGIMTLPCRAVVCHAEHTQNGFFLEKARPSIFPNKDHETISFSGKKLSGLTAAHYLKPKKLRGNGSDWGSEPKDGLKSVLLGAAAWTVLSLAFPATGWIVLSVFVAMLLMGLAFGIGMRALKKGRPSDRFLSIIGIVLGSPVLLVLILMSTYAVFSFASLMIAIPFFLLFLVLGF